MNYVSFNKIDNNEGVEVNTVIKILSVTTDNNKYPASVLYTSSMCNKVYFHNKINSSFLINSVLSTTVQIMIITIHYKRNLLFLSLLQLSM
jgi:hypothetical protein